ncbi:MAG: glycosyltransferase family 39 protein [Planctomycetes bacterium]|nr:glycosyltransferase family 39 protein [Planctomycetota bacterium]
MSAPHDPVRERFPWRGLLLWLAIALVLRIGTNLSRVDENPAEGLYRGTLAYAFTLGMPVWPTHWYEISHVPGSFVVSLLATPFYALFGPTTFALRMAGTVFHLAGVAAWYCLLYRRLGRRAALFGTSPFVLAPAGFAKMAVLSYGDHCESLPFFLAAALFAMEWAHGRSPRLLAHAFAAGIFVSFGIGFHLQGALGVGAVAATSFLLSLPRYREPRFYFEIFCGFLPGVVVGALPPLLGYFATGKSSIMLWGYSPTNHLAASDSVGKFLDLWRDGFAFAFQTPFRWLADGTLLASYGAALALGALAMAERRRTGRSLREIFAAGGFFWTYPAVFAFVYARSSSAFQVEGGLKNALEVRYVLPVLPFLLLPLPLLAARFADRGRRAAAALVFVPFLGVGAYGSLSTWDIETILREPARRGYLWEEFNGHFLYAALSEPNRAALRETERTHRGDKDSEFQISGFLQSRAELSKVIETIRRYDDAPEWTLPLRYIPPRIPLAPPPGFTPSSAGSWLGQLPARQRAFACVAIGAALVTSGDPRRHDLSPLLAATTPADHQLIARGVGLSLLDLFPPGVPARPRFFRGAFAAARVTPLPEVLARADIGFGFGFRLGKVVNAYYLPGDLITEQAQSGFPESWQEGFARGLGAGYRMRFLTPPPGDLDTPAVRHVVSILRPRLVPAFRAGFSGSPDAR